MHSDFDVGVKLEAHKSVNKLLLPSSDPEDYVADLLRIKYY